MSFILSILKVLQHALPLLGWFMDRIKRRKPREEKTVTSRAELEKTLDDGTF